MQIKVFDTHVRTRDGRYLHFDVLIDSAEQPRAERFARDWLGSLGLANADIAQSQCLYCHSESAPEPVAAAMARDGYFIIPLQGFEAAS
ncbi:DUF2024 family protein [Aquipseudomonas alcaligenes]